jgi:hypothetical protein
LPQQRHRKIFINTFSHVYENILGGNIFNREMVTFLAGTENGISRSTVEYKTDIFKLWHDWNDLRLRKLILKYNMEDVLNLIRLKKYIFNDCAVTKNDLNELLLS